MARTLAYCLIYAKKPRTYFIYIKLFSFSDSFFGLCSGHSYALFFFPQFLSLFYICPFLMSRFFILSVALHYFFCNKRLYMYNKVPTCQPKVPFGCLFFDPNGGHLAFGMQVKLRTTSVWVTAMYFFKKLANLLIKFKVLLKIYLVVALRGSENKHKTLAKVCQ